jgi:iron complex outermembrane receptor protein
MNRLQKKALATALFACWSGCAAALSEEEELALVYGDKETVSIATGSKQPLRRAPAVASVITAADIAATGAKDLDEVLETVPGIHVSRSPVRYASIIIIRGIGGGGPTNPQVLLLQNGIPLTTMYNGDKGAAWNGVPLENIARIEIIRGPGSALYGADAYSGVINIITKTAAESAGTQYGFRAGSFNSRDGWVQHGGNWGEVEVAAYLRVGSTDGIKETIRADAQSANDIKYGTAASLAPGSVNTGYNAVDGSLDLSLDKWRLRSSYKMRDKLQTGAGISSALDPTSLGRTENLLTDLSWNDPQFAQDWSAGATASALYYILTYPDNVMLLPPGATVGPVGSPTYFPDGMIGGPNQWEREFRFSGFATYSGFENHSLRFGAGHDNLDMYKTRTNKNYTLSATGVPINPGPVLDYTGIQPHILPHLRRVDYVVAQDEWNFAKDWSMTAGVRHDRYSDFGGTTNPRLALVWDATLDLTAKLLYGQAFRAPSFNEQYGINPVVNGNPNLKPETMRTLEAAFAWQARRDTQVNLSLFRYDMHDIIRPVANPAPAVGTTYQNVGSQHGSGMELEAVWEAGRTLRVSGNYAYQQSIDEASGRDAGYAPHHHLYARADWRVGGDWLLSPQINRVVDRRRAAGDTRPAVPDYTTFDVTARTADTYRQWDLAVSVRNLFDADVREPSLAPGTAIPDDLPMAPRSLWLQTVYKL